MYFFQVVQLPRDGSFKKNKGDGVCVRSSGSVQIGELTLHSEIAHRCIYHLA